MAYMEKNFFSVDPVLAKSFRYAFERKYLDQISADIYFSFVFFHLYLTT